MNAALKIITNGVGATAAILIVIGSLVLPSNPESSLYPTILFIGFCSFTGALMARFNGQAKSLLNILVTLSVVLVAIVATRPIGKTVEEALSINAQNRAALQDGIAAAEELKESNSTVSVTEIEEKLSKTYSSVQLEIAKKAIFASLEEDLEEIEVQEIVDPQIKLIEGSWNCRAEGCAFRGQYYVFTVSTEQQWAGMFLLLSGYAYYLSTLVPSRKRNYIG